MANLVISGGLTLSGGLEVGFSGAGGGGGGAASGSGTARSLFSQQSVVTLGGSSGDWSSDSYSYTVTGGVMTLNFSLQSNVAGGTINSIANAGTIAISLPAGYVFDSSVVGAQINHVTYTTLNVGATELATAAMKNSANSFSNLKVYKWQNNTNLMTMFYMSPNPGPGWSWGVQSAYDGAEIYARYLTGSRVVDITFTATIPVVAV